LKRKQVTTKAWEAVRTLDQHLDYAERTTANSHANEKWLANWVIAAKASETSDDDAVQFFLANSALGRARKDMQPKLLRPTMRLLLQLSTSDCEATIDPTAYRAALAKLRGKPR
jgi:hypothetical protein